MGWLWPTGAAWPVAAIEVTGPKRLWPSHHQVRAGNLVVPHDDRQVDRSAAVEIGDDIVRNGSRTFEVNPPDVLSPGVAVKAAGGRVYGHPAVGGAEVDPARVGAPDIAGKVARAVIVHAIVSG